MRSKTAAMLLAVFFGYWTWVYTFCLDWWKFVVGVISAVLTFALLILPAVLSMSGDAETKLTECLDCGQRWQDDAGGDAPSVCQACGSANIRVTQVTESEPGRSPLLRTLALVCFAGTFCCSWLWPVIHTALRPSAFYADYPLYGK